MPGAVVVGILLNNDRLLPNIELLEDEDAYLTETGDDVDRDSDVEKADTDGISRFDAVSVIVMVDEDSNNISTDVDNIDVMLGCQRLFLIMARSPWKKMISGSAEICFLLPLVLLLTMIIWFNEIAYKQ